MAYVPICTAHQEIDRFFLWPASITLSTGFPSLDSLKKYVKAYERKAQAAQHISGTARHVTSIKRVTGEMITNSLY